MTASYLKGLYTGPDLFARRGSDEESIGDKYARRGLKFQAAPTDRVSRAAELLTRLGNPEADISPSLYIFDTCRRLIDCIPSLEHDPHRPEDVLKINTDAETGEGGDDFYDALTYGLMAIAGPDYEPPGTARYA